MNRSEQEATAHERDEGTEQSALAARAETITPEMEDEVLGLLGAMLGLIEVLSIDTGQPLAPRQRSVVDDALKMGDRLHARVEGLITLLADPRHTRARRAPYALRRLIDHAVRGASWSANERGVRMVLPELAGLGEELLFIDVSRVDRAVRAITDSLVAALPAGGELTVKAGLRDGSVWLELAGTPCQSSAARELSRLLALSWQRIFALHGGSLDLDQVSLRVHIELPRGAR